MAQAGARDTAAHGAPTAIHEAMVDLLEQATTAWGARPDTIVCSGMITSNLGLHEVPHLFAPAGPHELAAGIVHVAVPDVGEVSFVPGIKTQPDTLTLHSLDTADMLRGEEVEVTGLRAHLALCRSATFLHFGSHHKAVDVDAEGRITGSRTALTGELLATVAAHTILKSSVVPLERIALELDAAVAGAEATLAHGVGRSLFLVRVGEHVAARSPSTMASYLVGALAALDLALLPPPCTVPIVLYGHGPFPEVLNVLLERAGYDEVLRVDGPTADRAAVEGAVELSNLAESRR